jgi:uncharacterized Ntn-hydrolase superfamily protein
MTMEFNTFTIVGRCARTGMLGVGIATHAYAVGARCPFVRAGTGAVATQATTDPRLGRFALNLLETGYSAQQALEVVAASDRFPMHHQIGIVDRDGNGAACTGSANKDWAGHITGENFVAMGNYLTSSGTAEAIAASFRSTGELDLDERLLLAIEAGRDAGGQRNGQRSAALIVHHREAFSWVDLRVDASVEPIAELRRIHGLFSPLKEHFSRRAIDPTLAPVPDA